MAETESKRAEYERRRKLMTQAINLYNQVPKAHWLTVFTRILGAGGAADMEFLVTADRDDFDKTYERSYISRIINRLRVLEKQTIRVAEEERVVTVRMPRCLHQALKAEAHRKQTSLNQLCITKLLEPARPLPSMEEAGGDLPGESS
jgi:predicted HicB family RNase H-like nuclease